MSGGRRRQERKRETHRHKARVAVLLLCAVAVTGRAECSSQTYVRAERADVLVMCACCYRPDAATNMTTQGWRRAKRPGSNY